MEVTKLTNLSVKFYGELASPGFGRLLINGTWTGLVGELVSDRADMVTTLAPTFERMQYVDYSTSSYVNPLVMCLRTSQATRQWHALIDPLTPFVWLCTLLTFITMAVAFGVSMIIFDKNWGRKCIELILGIFGVFLEQSTAVMQRNPARSLFKLWITFCYLIGTAYRSNLVTFLTFLQGDPVPETFKELSEDASYSIILHSVGGHELSLLKKSKNPIFKRIGDSLKVDSNMAACLQAAASSKSACIGWLPYLTSAFGADTEGNLESLFISKNWATSIWVGAAFRQGSIFTDQFSHYVQIAREAHLLTHWQQSCLDTIKMENVRKAEEERKEAKQIEGEILRRNKKSDNFHHAFNFSDVFIVFVVTGSGILISLFCFFKEIMKDKSLYTIFRRCVRASLTSFINISLLTTM